MPSACSSDRKPTKSCRLTRKLKQQLRHTLSLLLVGDNLSAMYSSGHFPRGQQFGAQDNSCLIVIGLVWVSYIAWPLYQLTVLVRAIDAHDVSTVVRYVN